MGTGASSPGARTAWAPWTRPRRSRRGRGLAVAGAAGRTSSAVGYRLGLLPAAITCTLAERLFVEVRIARSRDRVRGGKGGSRQPAAGCGLRLAAFGDLVTQVPQLRQLRQLLHVVIGRGPAACSACSRPSSAHRPGCSAVQLEVSRRTSCAACRRPSCAAAACCPWRASRSRCPGCPWSAGAAYGRWYAARLCTNGKRAFARNTANDRTRVAHRCRVWTRATVRTMVVNAQPHIPHKL